MCTENLYINSISCMIILFSIFTVFNCLKSYEFFYTMYKNINFNKY